MHYRDLLKERPRQELPAPVLAGGQGFEPQLMDPKSIVLPLDDPPSATPTVNIRCQRSRRARSIRCRDPDLNWGHQHFQCCALPTELSRRVCCLHQQPGIPAIREKKDQPGGPVLRERAMRFELTTFSLARRRSTTELRPHHTGAAGFEPATCGFGDRCSAN